MSLKKRIFILLFLLLIVSGALLLVNYYKRTYPDRKMETVHIEVIAGELDLVNKKLQTDITIYVSQNVSGPIFVKIGGFVDNTIVPINKTVHYHFENESIDYWEGTASLKVNIIGWSDWYPFDEYKSFLSFENLPLNETKNTSVLVTSSSQYFWNLRYDLRDYGANDSIRYVNIPVDITLERNSWWSYAVFLPIVATYAMLGASLWIDASKKIETKITLFLAVFAASFTQLLAVPGNLPFRYFLLSELLLFILIACSSIFAVSSILQHSKVANREKLDLLALSFSLSLISICFAVMSIFANIVASSMKNVLPVILFSLLIVLLWNWYSKPVRVFQALSIQICITNVAIAFFLVLEYSQSSISLFNIIMKFLFVGAFLPAVVWASMAPFTKKLIEVKAIPLLWALKLVLVISVVSSYLPLLGILRILPT